MVLLINIGILASTRATDMQAIIDAIDNKVINAKISVVVSNNGNAYALERAKKHNIKAVFIKSDGSVKEENEERRREIFDGKVANVLDNNGVDLILLIGYMRILSPWFVRKYKNRIMNIHPSLLPDFAGGMDSDVHEKVLKSGVKETGCTLHFVDEGTDTGPIIFQEKVMVDKDETIDSLKERVQKAEQKIILKAIKLFEEGRIKVTNNKVKIQ